MELLILLVESATKKLEKWFKKSSKHLNDLAENPNGKEAEIYTILAIAIVCVITLAIAIYWLSYFLWSHLLP
jgi:hypothetical protein